MCVLPGVLLPDWPSAPPPAADAAIDSRLALWVSSSDCLDPLRELYWLRRFWSELFMANGVPPAADSLRGDAAGGGSGVGLGEGLRPPPPRPREPTTDGVRPERNTCADI